MGELLWSLPFRAPFPFPATPNYATISSNALPLHPAYLNALYLAQQSPQITLDNFTRFLIRLIAAESDKAALEMQLRSIVLPIHDFDQKWRTLVLATLLPSTTDDAIPPEKPKKSYAIAEKEKEILLQAHERWKASIEPIPTSATDASAPSIEPPAARKGSEWTVPDQNIGDWVNTLELNETRLQSLLLLVLIHISHVATLSDNVIAAKPKRKKDPERHSSTLDPELLLDFLTDRLQIWRLMNEVKGLGTAPVELGGEALRVEKERDEVQEWWEDIVEVLFLSLVPSTLLAHHRAKLFPSPTSSISLSSRIIPAPSPFKMKDRTLLSLDKSARKSKEWNEASRIVESPTMRRLTAGRGGSVVARELEGIGEVFKLPAARKKLGSTNSSTSLELDSRFASLSTARSASPKDDPPPLPNVEAPSRAPRKQIRPLPRGDGRLAANGSSKALFNRREVSTTRRSTSVGVGKKVEKERGNTASIVIASTSEEGGLPKGRKRKSVSPRKLSTLQSNPTSALGPAPPGPNFASLGAAFRPGFTRPSDLFPLPFEIPPAPILASDAFKNPAGRLAGKKEKSKQQQEDDDMSGRWLLGDSSDAEPESEVVILGTPMKAASLGTGWIVPDTPMG